MANLFLDDYLHKKYKKLCSDLGKIMKKQTRALILAFLEEHEKDV